jgi:flagellar biosynthesis protein FlhG
MSGDDQAATLRHLARGVIPLDARRERTIAITGGKGGVGKSTLAVNLAVAYARRGARALAIDGDLGMADLNLLLGVAPERSLLDVVRGCPVEQILVAAHGIHLLPALNGSYALENLDAPARDALLAAIQSLDRSFDTRIVDVAAGIGATQTCLAGAVADPVVVVTPEPLSLADAYACLKVLARHEGVQHAHVVANRVRSQAEADEVVARLTALVGRFLELRLSALPAIPLDPLVADAAASGVPLVLSHPDAPASRAIKQLARRLDALAADRAPGPLERSWRRAFGAAVAEGRP